MRNVLPLLLKQYFALVQLLDVKHHWVVGLFILQYTLEFVVAISVVLVQAPQREVIKARSAHNPTLYEKHVAEFLNFLVLLGFAHRTAGLFDIMPATFNVQ